MAMLVISSFPSIYIYKYVYITLGMVPFPKSLSRILPKIPVIIAEEQATLITNHSYHSYHTKWVSFDWSGNSGCFKSHLGFGGIMTGANTFHLRRVFAPKTRVINTSTQSGGHSCDSVFCLKKNDIVKICLLVGGFNPFEKYESKWESSPNGGEHLKKLKPPPSVWYGKMNIVPVSQADH